MLYQKQETIRGAWIKKDSELNDKRAKLVTETKPIPSNFKDKEGNATTQNVSKIQIEEKDEVVNIAINKPSINALIDAFGEDSKSWVNHTLKIKTEKMMVSGKRVIALYLIPEGYELTEDDNGFIIITKSGEKETTELPPEDESMF